MSLFDISLLKQVINYVSVASDTKIETRSAKICSGQEADKTNHLLQQLGLLIDQKRSVQNEAVIQRVKKQEGPEALSGFAKSSLFLSAFKPLEGKLQQKSDVQKSPAARESASSSSHPGNTASTKTPASSSKDKQAVKSGPIVAEATLRKQTISGKKYVKDQISVRLFVHVLSLSLPFSLSACLFECLRARLAVSVCLHVCLSVCCLFVSLFVCLSVSQSVCLSTYLSVRRPVGLSICLYNRLPICLSA